MTIVDVKYTEEGDAFIEFPPETIEGLGWTEGTVVEWIDNEDGSWTIRKKEDMTDFVSKVVGFNRIAGTGAQFDARKVALYIGLQLEELSEKIEAINDGAPDLVGLIEDLHDFSSRFKSGFFDDAVNNGDRVAMLDADIDLAVVALGGACALGADVNGACHEVMDSNLSKFPIVNGERVAIKDANGKVVKAEGYRPPSLEKFL